MIFLYGVFLKSRVYVNCPRTLQDLKTNIQEEIANIAPAISAMLAGVMTKARNWFTQCMEHWVLTFEKRKLCCRTLYKDKGSEYVYVSWSGALVRHCYV